MGLCEEALAETSLSSWSSLGFFPPPSYPVNATYAAPLWLKGKGDFVCLYEPSLSGSSTRALRRQVPQHLRGKKEGVRVDSEKAVLIFSWTRHSSIINSQCSLEGIEKHPVPRANPFLLTASLSAEAEACGGLVCTRKGNSSSYSIIFVEWDSWKCLIDFLAPAQGFSMGLVRTITKGPQWLGKNVFYAAKSCWIKLRGSSGPAEV